MEISEYVKQSKLTKKILLILARDEIIHDPLTEDDLLGLRLLEKLWYKKEFLRAQLVKFSDEERMAFLTTAHLPTKWERYAYSRFFNLGPGERLPMKQLVSEIEMTFGFVLNFHHTKRLYKVREQVYNRRKKLVNRRNK